MRSLLGCAWLPFVSFLTIFAAGAFAAPTFTKDVAPILYKHCAQCHSPGQIAAAVPLLSYQDARPWAKSIKEKVLSREMPPWPADPARSLPFRNDARLGQPDIDMIAAWVDAGCPRGNGADLPAAPKLSQDWQYPNGRPPDAIVSLPAEFAVPAAGVIPYVKILAAVPFDRDQWVVASQLMPGNAAVVHHMAITELELADWPDLEAFAILSRQLGIPKDVTPTRPAVADPADPAVFDMLSVYTPGSALEVYPEGVAKLVKGGKGKYLNFNIHYTATGKPEKDRSRLALWFQPEPPKHQLFRVPAALHAILAAGQELLTDSPGEKAEGTIVAIPPIPPHADNYEVIGMTAYTEPVTIYQFQPHAHLRGKDFKYVVIYPDGREQTVLTVPKYDFNWQLAYDLQTPLKLPAGSKLVVTAHYDNSANNKSNPAPEKAVYFRAENQSWDEMFTPFIQYTIDGEDISQSGERRNRKVLDIAEAAGCLEPGGGGDWLLNNAGEPVVTGTQATSSAELQEAAARPLGHRTYQLLGVNAFHPLSRVAQEVVVRGALIQDGQTTRLNVTSLQPLPRSSAGPGCQRQR